MTHPTIEIAGKTIGIGQPAFLIAEVAQTHDGSLGLAHAFIDAAADTGADAIKFQTHIADAESTLDEEFRVAFSKQDKTRYDYWKRMEFTPEQWSGLAEHASARGVVFLSSAFSVAAINLLEAIGIPAWKVGSGEFRSDDLLARLCETGFPVIFSTGMSTWQEIETAVAAFQEQKSPLALLQCTSRYPTPLEEVGLNVIDDLRNRFDVPVGLSDHSGSIYPSLAALARGANLIEVHLTLDRRLFGPDVPVSLTPDEMRKVCEARDAFAVMDANPVDKETMAKNLSTMRDLFTKSLAVTRPLAAGTRLTPDMLTSKKPGTGIPAGDLGGFVGRTLARDVSPDRLLSLEDIDGG